MQDNDRVVARRQTRYHNTIGLPRLDRGTNEPRITSNDPDIQGRGGSLKIHGQVVSGRACAEIALELGVPAMLERAYPDGFEGGLAPAELIASERAMASIVESLIGACYL